MTSQAIDLKVSASIPVSCKFWREDDGWVGTCDQFSVRVEGTSFEDVKRNMEAHLQSFLESILPASANRQVA
jgi:hypothetical protein